MTRGWLLAVPLALLSGCTWQQRGTLDLPQRRDQSWWGYRIDPNDVDDAQDAKELADIERRISAHELPKIQFDFDSDVIRPESFATLDVVADWALRHPRRKLRITAHTCSIGTEKYNLDLSERRAKSVYSYLVKQGVPPPTIRYKGVGFSQPLVPNDTEAHRELNRRVEFRLVDRDWASVY